MLLLEKSSSSISAFKPSERYILYPPMEWFIFVLLMVMGNRVLQGDSMFISIAYVCVLGKCF